jgi:hypothetical protein
VLQTKGKLTCNLHQAYPAHGLILTMGSCIGARPIAVRSSDSQGVAETTKDGDSDGR